MIKFVSAMGDARFRDDEGAWWMMRVTCRAELNRTSGPGHLDRPP